MPQRAPESRSRRATTWIRCALWLIPFVTLLVAGATLWARHRMSDLARQLPQRLERDLPGRFTWESCDWRLWPPGFKLQDPRVDVRLGSLPAKLLARSATWRLADWTSLLAQPKEPMSIHLEGACFLVSPPRPRRILSDTGWPAAPRGADSVGSRGESPLPPEAVTHRPGPQPRRFPTP